MSDKPRTPDERAIPNGGGLRPEEQAFLAETGLRPDDLAHLVNDAPPLPPDALARIRNRTREKTGTAVAHDAAPATLGSTLQSPPSPSSQASPVQSLPSPKSSATTRRPRRWLAAAAAVLLLVGGSVVLSNPGGAMAAIQRIVRLVPGIGLTETDGDTLVLAEPVSVQHGDVRVTVTGVVGARKRTQVQFRAEWPAVRDKQELASRTSAAELRLPDGTVLEGSGHRWGGSDKLEGEYWYDPLPEGTREVVLVLPFLSGTAEPVEIPLSLVSAEEAGLAEGRPGAWSTEQMGVKVGVPYWTAAGDRIVVALESRVPDGVTVEQFGERFSEENMLPSLSDDQGRVYPLIAEESVLLSGQRQAVFQGPLAPDAGELKLSVPALTLVEHAATARLTVPSARLPEGEPLELNEELAIGSQRFTVRAVTRLSPGIFRIDLDLGQEADGALLQRVDVRPPMSPFRSGPSGWSAQGVDGQMTQMEIDFKKPPTRNLEIVFASPTYRLKGGWEVHLPVPGSSSGSR